jgi:Flp pilus assembly pilin Flp
MDITDFLRSRKFPFFVRQIPDKAIASIRARMKLVWAFWRAEEGQDLIEYTLFLAFVTMASAALFLGAGKNVK